MAFHEEEEELQRAVVAVMSKAGHRGAVSGHVDVASEKSAHWEMQGGVVREKAGITYSPYVLLFVCCLCVNWTLVNAVCFLYRVN
jgi:hypothetical protein